MTGRRRHLSDSLLTVVVVVVLVGLAALGWRMFFSAPMVWQVKSIQVSAGERPVVLGHRELGQRPGGGRSAELNHLQLENRDGRWWLANVAAYKRLDAPSDERSTRFVKRWRLAQGDRLTIGSTVIEVESVSAETLDLTTREGQRASWRVGLLQTENAPFDACPREGSRWWQHLLDRWRHRELSLFTIGGQVDCPRRWSLHGLPVDSLGVRWVDGAFWAAPGSSGTPVSLQRSDDGQAWGFDQLQLPVGEGADDAQRIYLGRSGYRLHSDGSDLVLTPIGGTDVWREDEARPLPRDPRVKVEYRLQRWLGANAGPGVWLQSHSGWLFAALLLSALSMLRYTRARRRRRATAAASLMPASVLGLTVSLGMWLQPDIDARWLFWMGWLGWGWSSVVVLEANRLRGLGGWLWLLGMLLAGSGALLLGQLAAGGDSSRWLGFATGHWGLWAMLGWALGMLAPVTVATWRGLLVELFTARSRFWVLLRWAVSLLLAAVLIVQVAVGREEGLAGVQPVEAAKLLLVFLLAFAGMRLTLLRQVRGGAYRGNRLAFVFRITGFALLFWILADALLWAVRDMSPVLILGLLVLAVLWKMAPAPRGVEGPQRSVGGWLLRAVLLAAMTAFAVLAVKAYLNPEQLPQWLPQYDRFQVWADPTTHPHSGMQVLAAMDLAGSGAWWGALPSWWGWNGEVMRLPAVQDDFITAFLLHRFGAVAGLMLLAVQLLFLALLFALGRSVDRTWVGTEGVTGHGVSLVLYGLAWLFAAHWIIAWGNVLGLLPVMGQPMTWLAAGNSHLLLFAYPALAFALVVAWSGERGAIR